jgi:hypothetical protein
MRKGDSIHKFLWPIEHSANIIGNIDFAVR